ncbi:MAG: hypothetical protein HQL63_12915 [Magnetococcales bacterium]|nr:hypothetical protein [Magnetococcales bacterium]MBF0321805.1 hypothetical protein [Magnetococcales bacterium]
MTFAVDKSWAAVFAQRQMGRSSSPLGRPFRRLVSGAQIHEETEDDSEYDFLSGMNVRIRELNQALRDANDGISLTQLAGDGLREMEAALQQIRTLLGPGGALADKRLDLSGIQTKIRELIDDVDRVARESLYGDGNLPEEKLQSLESQLEKGGSMGMRISSFDVNVAGNGLDTSRKPGVVSDVKHARNQVDRSMVNVAGIRNEMDDVLSKFELAVVGMNAMAENMVAARVRTEDLSSGSRVIRQIRNTVIQEAGTIAQAQGHQQGHAVLTLVS